MKKTIKSPYSYDHKKDSDVEHPEGDSLTIQGQELTVSEILNRQRQGIFPDFSPQITGFETDDHDAIDVSKINQMDLTELDELHQELGDKIDIYKQEMERVENEEKLEKKAPEKTEQNQTEKQGEN